MRRRLAGTAALLAVALTGCAEAAPTSAPAPPAPPRSSAPMPAPSSPAVTVTVTQSVLTTAAPSPTQTLTATPEAPTVVPTQRRSLTATPTLPATPQPPVTTTRVGTEQGTEALQAAVARGEAVDCARHTCVALTFEGSAGGAARLLETLTRRRAVATFFVVGAEPDSPALTHLLATPGMEVGNGTVTRPALTRIPLADAAWEIAANHDALVAAGARPGWLRPPYGMADETTAALARDAGEAVVTWDLDAGDELAATPEEVVERVVTGTKPGYVVALHADRRVAADALPDVVDGLYRQGYLLVPLSQLTGTPAPGSVHELREPGEVLR